MIAIIDYGAGNIFSVKNALDYLGIQGQLTADIATIQRADAIILPGVGAFPWAMKKLTETGLTQTLIEESKRKPFLGICLGMQLLLEVGYEFQECAGLGLISGSVEHIEAGGEVIPHMGWNRLEMHRECPLFLGLPEEAYVYFVHSYQAVTDDKNIAASVSCGTAQIPAMITDGKYVFGAQFHPEKSGDVGLKILQNFCAMVGNGGAI